MPLAPVEITVQIEQTEISTNNIKVVKLTEHPSASNKIWSQEIQKFILKFA